MKKTWFSCRNQHYSEVSTPASVTSSRAQRCQPWVAARNLHYSEFAALASATNAANAHGSTRRLAVS
jgi:hypothetical protein